MDKMKNKKSNSLQDLRLLLTFVSLPVIGALLLFGCTSPREIGVYTLCNYEDSWKSNVCVNSALDPGGNFWTLMTSGTGSPYADSDGSRRYQNSEVTIETVLPIAGDSKKGWDEFDLVFFYGHHNMIVPPHPHSGFGYYTYNGTTWDYNYGLLDDIGWGNTTPYDYYTTRGITSGNTHPGSVTYLYHKYTSALLGGLYHYGQGSGMLWRVEWDDPIIYAPYGTKAWQLGAIDLEWLILHGCQAVITANESGTNYNSMGLKCFHWTQGKFHIVLGHYRSFYTTDLKSLNQFAIDLMAGVPVQTAYFDVDPDNNSSAIAAEPYPFPGWSASTMANDKWTNQMTDNENTSIFSQRWIRNVGTTAQYWD